MTKRRLITSIAVLAGFLAIALFAAAPGGPDLPPDFPTHTVARGEFRLTLTESGELSAAGGEMIKSPDIGGRLKILYLWPEGEQVQVGDLILQFDPAEFERDMLDAEGELDVAKAEFEKLKTQQDTKLKEREIGIVQQEEGFKLSKIQLEMAKYKSPIDLETAQIQYAKAERAMQQTHEDFEAQKIVRRVTIEKQKQQIARRQKYYNRARENYEKTSITAPGPGIVVYRKIWKRGGSGRQKVQVGDEIWGGRALMDIPDLSRMQVTCMIGEVDLKRLAVGQHTFIRLDAFPGPVFHGEVSEISPMAIPQPDAPDIQIFEFFIDIEEKDTRLKPGMSAQVEIVLETTSEALTIPLSAVFKRDSKDIVYCLRGGSFEPVEVQLGKHNGIDAVVESGLEEGEIVALQDPRFI